MTRKYTLPKSAKLKSRKLINQLFESGLSYFKYPFKLMYIIEQADSSSHSEVQFSVSVPKKKIKSAVKRNLIKRRTREAYRLNKHLLDSNLKNSANHKISLMFIYIADDVGKYDIIEKCIVSLLEKLVNSYCP